VAAEAGFAAAGFAAAGLTAAGLALTALRFLGMGRTCVWLGRGFFFLFSSAAGLLHVDFL
jgi:hypothetical protein